jgi:hypothetical protein
MIFVTYSRVPIYNIYSECKDTILFVSQRCFVLCIMNFGNYTFLWDFKAFSHSFRKKM